MVLLQEMPAERIAYYLIHGCKDEVGRYFMTFPNPSSEFQIKTAHFLNDERYRVSMVAYDAHLQEHYFARLTAYPD